jgi:hypothetical protein
MHTPGGLAQRKGFRYVEIPLNETDPLPPDLLERFRESFDNCLSKAWLFNGNPGMLLAVTVLKMFRTLVFNSLQTNWANARFPSAPMQSGR